MAQVPISVFDIGELVLRTRTHLRLLIARVASLLARLWHPCVLYTKESERMLSATAVDLRNYIGAICTYCQKACWRKLFCFILAGNLFIGVSVQ